MTFAYCEDDAAATVVFVFPLFRIVSSREVLIDLVFDLATR